MYIHQEQNRRRDSRQAFSWIIAILLAVFVFLLFNAQDLSNGDTSVHVDKRLAETKAEQFWASRQVNLSGYMHTAILEDDTSLDDYLSLHAYSKAFQKSYQNVHPLQYWEITYYKHNSGLQYVTRIHPQSGTVLGFDAVQSAAHTSAISGSVTNAQLVELSSSNQVQQAATSFATQQLSRFHISGGLTLVKQTVANNQTTYTFDVAKQKIGNAPFQASVTLDPLSNQPLGFQTSFVVPKQDINWFAVQSKRSQIMTWIFVAGQVLFFLVALILLYIKRHKVRYGTAFGLIIAAFVIDWILNLNTLPSLQNQTGFLALSNPNPFKVNGLLALYIVFTTVLEVGMLYVITIAGGAISKDVLPNRWLSWHDPGWSKRIRSAAFRGYGLAIVWLALQSLFYYVGQTYFHVWEQNDTDSSPWNNVIPGFLPIAAWFAGINEELTFRLFGFSIVKKYMKSTWLSLLIPAMIWALGHSLYPVFPVYTRFIELTIFGVLIGWCMLKWDFETVVFAHVAFDSILMAISLVSDQPAKMAPVALLWGLSPLWVGWLLGYIRPRQSKLQLEP